MRALSPRRLLPLLFAPALAAACGGEGGPGASAGGTGGGDAGAELHALPPAPAPGAKAPDGAGSATFAVRRLYLGDTARDGTPDLAEGWRSYGFDLDGKISSASSADLCRPLHGASKEQVYPDGELGIDNAFGKRIVPILRGVDAELSQKIDQALVAGGRTSLFTLDQLGEGPDQGPISARFYLGAALDHPPSFDGSDAWPVRARSLADAADLGSATVTFPESYLVGDVWVGHAQGDLPVSVRLSPGVDLVLPLSHAVVVMKLDPDHRGATQGTIAGIVAIAALQWPPDGSPSNH